MPGLRGSSHRGRDGRHTGSRKEHPNIKSTYVRTSTAKPASTSTHSPSTTFHAKPAALRHPHAAKPATADKPAASVLTAPTAPVSIVAMDDDADHFVRGRQPSATKSAAATVPKRPLTEQLFRTRPTDDEQPIKPKKHRKRSADSPLLDIDTTTKRSKSTHSTSTGSHVELLTYRHLYVA